VKPFDGPPMATAADVAVQLAREKVYDARWARHRDQLLVAVTGAVVIALVAASLHTGDVRFAALALGAPGLAATFRAIHKQLAPTGPAQIPPSSGAGNEHSPTTGDGRAT
jgi:hypothetical protein